MGYYDGSAMALKGSYCIHYGRKGMKWYQNIFGDLSDAVSNGYRGAKTGEDRYRHAQSSAGVSSASIGGQAAINAVRRANTVKYSQGGYANDRKFSTYQLMGANAANAQGSSTASNFSNARDKAIATVGNAIGVTAYNATVVARKIADVATKVWSDIKSFGSSVIQKGKSLLESIFGTSAEKTVDMAKVAAAAKDFYDNNKHTKKMANVTASRHISETQRTKQISSPSSKAGASIAARSIMDTYKKNKKNPGYYISKQR